MRRINIFPMDFIQEKIVTQKEQGQFIIDGFVTVVFTVTILLHVSSVGGFVLVRLWIIKNGHTSFLLPEILNREAHYYTQLGGLKIFCFVTAYRA